LKTNNLQSAKDDSPIFLFPLSEWARRKLLPRALVLGKDIQTCEENILTLVHELFTGPFFSENQAFLQFDDKKEAPQ
jgi:hypothetical protein